LGLNHVDIGIGLCQKWNLPDVFSEAIRYHHVSANQILALKDKSTYKAIRITALASSMCDFILYGQSARSHSRTVTLAREVFQFDDEQTRNILSEIRTKSETLPDDFRIDATAIPSSDDILAQANELLATMSFSARAEADQIRATKIELETKNKSLQVACERLEKRATFDHLTELYNRAFLDAYLNKHLRQSRRGPHPIGVILCDIDRFKQVNDTYGHQFGDAVLQHVARVLKASVNDDDVVARYGGEEFIITTTNKSLEEISATAEAIRYNVENTSLEHGGIQIKITLSAGVSATDMDQDVDKITADALIAAADKAMYAAKAHGRNRVQAHFGQPADECCAVKGFPNVAMDTPTLPTGARIS
jgi:diguanylate cyclase (GGDEF)-like protein